MTPNPCRDCTEREIGCHSTCENYSMWRTEYNRIKKIRRKRLIEEAIITRGDFGKHKKNRHNYQ